MLKSLDIKGYLSHKKSHFSFVPGVNVIVGDSDVGKSTAIRSILKVATNRPEGRGMINWDMDTCSVSISTSEGSSVSWLLADSAKYQVNDGKALEAIGRGAPPEDVTKTLNLSPINFSLQSTEHFLLGDSFSGGVVAKMINEITNLTLIDSSIENIKKEARENLDLLREASSAREAAKEKVESLAGVPDLVIRHREISKTSEELLKLTRDIANLTACIDNSMILEEELQRVSSVIPLGESLKAILSIEKELKEKDQYIARLERLLLRSDKAAERMESLSSFEVLLEPLASLLGIRAEIEELDSRARKVQTALSRAASKHTSILALETQIKNDSARLEELMPDECPLCGRSK